ncbi:MAG: pteridine reductase [Casimicrobiaceae bacterium]|nr:pteridine reductase [Casimicrobiaceae bacterium]
MTSTLPPSPSSPAQAPVALVTGAARRVGAAIAAALHEAGYRVLIHYRQSAQAARELAARLEARRPGSTALAQLDLLEWRRAPELIEAALLRWGRLDALVNNASLFAPTALATASDEDWERLLGSNLRAPFELARAAAPHLKERQGAIVNITDIHAERPMAGYLLYSVAKAGLAQLTRALALELAPRVRVNAVAPGPIAWPEDGQIDSAERERILSTTPLRREGHPEQIAQAVRYLLCDAHYVTGHTLAVDGGRSIVL